MEIFQGFMRKYWAPVYACVVAVILKMASRIGMGFGLDGVGFLDAMAMILFFVFVLSAFAKWRNPAQSKILSVIFIGTLSFFYWGNLVFFRYFQTWLYWDSIFQLKNMGELTASIGNLVRLSDLIFVLPLFIWFFVPRIPWVAPARFFIRLGLVAVFLFSLHTFLFNPRLNLAQHDPFPYFFRQKAVSIVRSVETKNVLKEIGPHVREYFPIDQKLYSFEDRLDFPLQKKPIVGSVKNPRRPNVILIVMESVRAFESGAYGARQSVTPVLDRLSKEGILFRNYYSNGTQTTRAEFSMLASYLPNYHGAPIYSQFPNIGIRTMPEILKEAGYQTLWVSGFSPYYGNKKAFLSQNGIDEFYYQIPEPKQKIGWGPSDDDIFDLAGSHLAKQQQPFFAEIMTLSNHYPFDFKYLSIPQTPQIEPGTTYQGYLNGMFYTDSALGRFLTAHRDEKWFQNSIFVITSDNGVWLFPEKQDLSRVRKQEIYYRMPCLIWGPNFVEPQEISRPTSQIDLAPTILDMLKIYGENSFIGTSRFQDPAGPDRIFMLREERWSFREGNTYLLDTGPEVFQEHFPRIEKKILRSDISHATFKTDVDLLQVDLPDSALIIKDEERTEKENFVLGALEVFSYLIQSDRIFDDGPDQGPVQPPILTENTIPNFVAHAGGAVEKRIYTNSLEALSGNYQKGFRTFELDFQFTRDGQIVLAHLWNDPLLGFQEMAPTESEFKMKGKELGLTFLNGDELVAWLKERSDANVVIDYKGKSYLRLLRRISDTWPEMKGRFIPQIYHPDEFPFVETMGYQRILLTLYQGNFTIGQILGMPGLDRLMGVVMPMDVAMKTNLAARLSFRHIPVFVHTVNDPTTQKKLRDRKVDGFFVDYLPGDPNQSFENY